MKNIILTVTSFGKNKFNKHLCYIKKFYFSILNLFGFTNNQLSSIEDYFDRDIFAEEICTKIAAEHNKYGSSFIFGISGYWGEGKTHLLLLLEKKLKSRDFIVVWFSPWKYAQDPPALMRRFISLINQRLPKFFLPWNRRVNLSDFERDQNIFSLNIFWCLVFGFVFLLIIFIYKLIPDIHNFLYVNKTFLIVVFIPVAIAILSKLIVLQKTTKAASAIDQFDNRLNLILNRTKRSKKKIVVFVDDLDRVSGEKAKNVLDALRTFFDKSELTYVVTGDHKVLENHIGSGLTDDTNYQSYEGRNFLKKIFNIYWRLPIPTKTQMKNFISQKINSLSLADNEKEQFINWLLAYFDLNPRNIERFLEMVQFNILSLERRKGLLESNKNEKDNLEQINEVLSNKLLLIRALLIQEKAYPLYEKIVEEPSLIRSIEEKVDKNQEYSDIIQNLKITMNDPQIQFLSLFLPVKPRFYQDNGLKVRILPFFKLASELGLSDDRGLSLDGFETFLRNNNYQAIAQWLNLSKDVQSLASKTQQVIEGEGDQNIKKNYIITALQSVSDNQKVAAVFLSTLVSTINSSISPLETTVRMEVVNKTIELINKLDLPNGQDIVEQINFSQPDDLNHLTDNLGKNSRKILSCWIIAFMKQDFWNGLAAFSLRKDKFNQDDEILLQQQEDVVLSNFISANDEQRGQCLDFLELTSNGIGKIRNTIQKHYDSTNQDEKNRIINLIKSRYGNKTWGSRRVYKWITDGH